MIWIDAGIGRLQPLQKLLPRCLRRAAKFHVTGFKGVLRNRQEPRGLGLGRREVGRPSADHRELMADMHLPAVEVQGVTFEPKDLPACSTDPVTPIRPERTAVAV